MKNRIKTLALASCAMVALATAAHAQEKARFDIAGGDLKTALQTFAGQTSQEVLFSTDVVAGRRTKGVTTEADPQTALVALLDGTGLTYRTTDTGTLLIVKADTGPQSGSAAGGGAEVEALIVTAQKREEDIQDVPIAISAFTQKSLDEMKIEGGFDLLKAIPNVTFSKNNFTSYNFSIRGVGTKAVSATTDPGVSVSFNNTGIIQNRLFEQEYFDLERVEVLRGPQGTLYGRNATSGVINVISAKPRLADFEAYAKVEGGNYEARRAQGMINVPLLQDKLAVRLAGALTQRQGYDYNSYTQNQVNGRDLWSTRLSIGFEPAESLRGNFIWEHFKEDDNRSRTGKQLCHRDSGPETIGGVSVANAVGPNLENNFNAEDGRARRRSVFSQGCLPVNLYDDAAFETPNGLSYSFVLGSRFAPNLLNRLGRMPNNSFAQILNGANPYGDLKQSRNLREISSPRDPVYRASADLLELNFEIDLGEQLTLYSQTAYVEDETYSFQDYNRFSSLPVFTDTSLIVVEPFVGDWRHMAPRPEGSPVGTAGVFCDPQVGCANTLVGFDIAQGSAQQFSQEIRLQSDFEGNFNFSLGGNYTKFDTLIDYYVMYNLISYMAMTPLWDLDPNPAVCANGYAWDGSPSIAADDLYSFCPYVDLNPVDTSKNFEGDGHNYFRSKNPYKLESWAAFGEAYWNVADDVKLTAGLRYTDDAKTFTQVPSQVLLASGFLGGGTVARGYPVAGVIEQEWGEWTGRLVLDWKPDLSFTDDTLVYGSISHGYKGGGANPPQPGFADIDYLHDLIVGQEILTEADFQMYEEMGVFPVLQLTGVEYGETFEPEFVDAFELGAKNTLLGGAMTLNATAFFYDYKDYQVSQIRDRTAVNENFDAKVWGAELEMMFAPSRDLQIVGNIGYLDTEIADGETSIDIMNRTQGNPDYVLAKPWAQLPSNCVVPLRIATTYLETFDHPSLNEGPFAQLCGGVAGYFAIAAGQPLIDPLTGKKYNPLARDADGELLYPEINGGAGLLAELGGNELPNAPHWTANLGAQYGHDLWSGWRATVRGDVYWQSQSWHRVYNSDPYDKLHGWYNANLSVWFERPDSGLKIELYAKNILNDTPITDAFLNSDDTGLTTNVFTLDPRLIGLSIRKEF